MSIAALLVAAWTLAIPSPADPPADPPEAERQAAVKALDEMVQAYRDPRGLSVDIEVSVQAESKGGAGGSPSLRMKCLFGEKRQALVSVRDYQLRLAGGRIVATHDSNPLAYLDVSDHGSPYYAIFNAFQAMPIPELALALGEEKADEVCMQLMPQVPDVVPVRVTDDEIDGQACKVLVLESDDQSQSLKLFFDPETKLVEAAVGTKKGGPEAEDGAAISWKVKSRVERPKAAPDAKAFALDTAGKQKVDGLAALVVRDPDAAADRDVPGLKAGEPAPALALPKVGGGDWDMVAARPKPVLVDFWATWCGPCKAALPHLAALAAEFEGKVEFMMVNAGEQDPRDARETNIRKVFAERKVSLPCVLDLDGQAARRWLIRAFPTTFVIAPDGRIAGVWEGNSPANERAIHDKLKELTAAAPAPAPAPAAK